MKRFISLLIFMLFVFSFMQFSLSLDCRVASSCYANETCLFSMAYTNNSHVAACGYYSNNLCCTRFVDANIRSACYSNESAILSVFRNTNAHAASPNFFNYNVCASYYSSTPDCFIRTSCAVDEVCIVELAKGNNSHVASCGSGYPYKLCCRALSDLEVDSSSIQPNTTSAYVYEAISFNITVYNVGDVAATNVNVSCYADGNFFDYDIISSIPPDESKQQPRYASCIWQSTCPLTQSIEVRVDPLNTIKEYNESNNNASINITLKDRFNITIDNPKDGQDVYRGQTINLNSTVTAVCGSISGYNVSWYNSTHKIAGGEDATYTIGLSDSYLGPETINASVFYNNELHDYDVVTINILNNLPEILNISYNVTPPEIHAGLAIQIACEVQDVEDAASLLNVTINVKDPAGTWYNYSASNIGNTFYIDFQTYENSVLGNYTVVCRAEDTDNGISYANSSFLVYKNVTVNIALNNSEPWWNEAVLAKIKAIRKGGQPVQNGDVNVTVNTTLVCSNKSATDANGEYSCVFNAPASIGIYYVYAYVTDPLTGKTFSNYTQMNVTALLGQETRARNIACYEQEVIVQNPDGTLKKANILVCVYE